MSGFGRVSPWIAAAMVAMFATVTSPASASAAPAPAHARYVHDAKRTPEGDHGDDHYCDGCTPPLTYSGGPVLDTSGDSGLTITPVYWTPSDATPFADTYETIINQYIADVAADSGGTDNVYSVMAEYSATDASGAQTPL